MKLLMLSVGGLLGLIGVVLYIIKLFGGGAKAPVADSKPYIDLLDKKIKEDVKATDQKALDAQKKAEEELNAATDQEIVDRFHSVFGKPVPTDGKQPTGGEQGTKP
jgi:hypothetical protein